MLFGSLTQRCPNEHGQFNFVMHGTEILRQRQRLANVAQCGFRFINSTGSSGVALPISLICFA
jgi:hypothetical protein